jgi:hypothetical protein
MGRLFLRSKLKLTNITTTEDGVVKCIGQMCYCEHRDGRIWKCEVIKIPEHHPIYLDNYQWMLNLTTEGVVPVTVLCPTQKDGITSLLRFMNSSVEPIATITADAAPTYSHPLSGPEVDFAATWPDRDGRGPWDGNNTTRTLTGKGRLHTDTGVIAIYPTQEEVDLEIMTCTTTNARPISYLARRGDIPERFAITDRLSTRVSRLSTNVFRDAETNTPPEEALEYSLSAVNKLYDSDPGDRERMIDLG